MRDEGVLYTDFDDLRGRGLEAAEEGRFDEAERCYRQALAWAHEHGEENHVDLATCNLAAVAIQRGGGEGEIPRLREILLRSADQANCRLAAYHISVQYLTSKNYKKCAFYARLALDRARLLGREDWLASCHNQLGNALLSESLISEACAEYELALDTISTRPSLWRGRILDNLGYCRVLQGRRREGFSHLYESLSLLRRSEHYQVSTRLDLCFAHLETERYRHAWRHGLSALALAEKTQQPESVKNALYLLGETANLSGDPQTARGYFARLQNEFFPAAGYLPGFLLAVDVRKLINLHA